MKASVFVKIKLGIVDGFVAFLNFWLSLFEVVLFSPVLSAPKRVLIFKSGNIGDIVCAIPLFIAIRRTYPDAHITLWTSPGVRGIPGAVELLSGVWYLDEIEVYDSTDINSFAKIGRFAAEIKKGAYDLFIHVPVHDWMRFRTIVRNMIFIRAVGFRHAFGFRVRTIIRLFKKTQVDYTIGAKEVDSLLDIFKEKGICADRVEFDFPISEEAEVRIAALLRAKWPDYDTWRTNGGILVALHDGSKRKEKKWLPERFGQVVNYLEETHKARVVILGGPGDRAEADQIKKYLMDRNVLVLAGELSMLETISLVKKISFLLGIDSGPMHLAGALGKPTVALFSVLGIIGKWYPYGEGHEAVFRRFLSCNYADPNCQQKSMEAISIEEVKEACDRVIGRLLNISEK